MGLHAMGRRKRGARGSHFNPWKKRKGHKRNLYTRLVLGELAGLARVPYEAGFHFDQTPPREIDSMEAKGLSPEAAAVEIAMKNGMEIDDGFVGLCPYCAEWLPKHRSECELLARRVARRRPLC